MNDESKKGDLIQEPVKQGEIVRDTEKKDVTIKISEPDFAQMVVDLLGKKQTLEQEINEAFLLKNIGDIAQFHYLLTEKIEKEQYTTLNLFSVTILYNDNSKRTVNDVRNIQSFLETRNVIAQSVFLAWEIVLKYPNKDSIEKQKLEISFSVKEERPFGNIKINIEHTSQVWASEVLMLFQSHINKLISPQRNIAKIANFINEFFSFEDIKDFMYNVFILFIVLLAFKYIPILSSDIEKNANFKIEVYQELMEIDRTNNTKLQNDIFFQQLFITLYMLDKPSKFEHPETSRIINQMLESDSTDPNIRNVLEKHINKSQNSKKVEKETFSVFLVFSLILGIYIIISYYSRKLAKFHEERSFILITTESEKQHAEFVKSKNVLQFYSFNAIMIAIICGFIAGLILEVLKIFAR